MWASGLQVFIVEQVAQHAARPAYSLTKNFVSDLGQTQCNAHMCSPLHGWLNASFILQGLLFLGGAYLLRRSFPPLPESSAAMTFITICGLAIIGAGMSPGDLHHRRHILSGGVCFISGSLALVMFGMVLLNGRTRMPLAGWSTIAVGLIVGIATGVMELCMVKVVPPLMPYMGLLERIPAYVIPLWVAVVGIALFFRTKPEFEDSDVGQAGNSVAHAKGSPSFSQWSRG